MPQIPLHDLTPRFGGVFCAPDAWLIGDVEIAEDASVWFGSVLRGDVEPIRVGARTNLQDGCIVHGTSGVAGVVIGDRVTVGHGAVLHACTIEDEVLIGMRATVLDRAVVESCCIVAAGALVTPGQRLESGWLYAGAPARPKRPLREEEIRSIGESADRYVEHARRYAGLNLEGQS